VRAERTEHPDYSSGHSTPCSLAHSQMLPSPSTPPQYWSYLLEPEGMTERDTAQQHY